MRLSIIIPVYNVEKYISRCLESLCHQSLSQNDYEILIVNDGSTDNSVAIANQYVDKYANFKLIDKENGGVGSARNKGIAEAKGNYIYFIDPDDYLATNLLKILLDYADNYSLEILTFSTKKTLESNLTKSYTKHIKNLTLKVSTGIEYIACLLYTSPSPRD